MDKKRLTREQSQQQTRERLLKVATSMFAKRGFYDTSVDRIAEAAGYSKGAVYSNFGSKDDLFLAVFSNQQTEDIDHIEKKAETFNSLEEFIQFINKNHELERKENRDWSILKLEFLLYAMRQETVRINLAEILEENRVQMTNILKKFYPTDTGKLDISIDHLAFILLSLDIGIGIQSYVDEESTPKDIYSLGLQRLLDI